MHRIEQVNDKRQLVLVLRLLLELDQEIANGWRDFLPFPIGNLEYAQVLPADTVVKTPETANGFGRWPQLTSDGFVKRLAVLARDNNAKGLAHIAERGVRVVADDNARGNRRTASLWFEFGVTVKKCAVRGDERGFAIRE